MLIISSTEEFCFLRGFRLFQSFSNQCWDFISACRVIVWVHIYFVELLPSIRCSLSFLCARSMWQREGAVRLFVEHVISFNDEDDISNSESVVRLWKVQCFVS